MVSLAPAKCGTELGHLWEGTPTGEMTTFAQVSTYIATPPSKATDKVVLLLTDIFGHNLTDTQLVADEISRAGGFLVIMPDLFSGNPYPPNARFDGEEHWAKFQTWFENYDSPQINKIIQPVLSEIRQTYKPKAIGAAGYSFGAKYVVQLLAGQNAVDAGYIAYPPTILKEEFESVGKPLFIAAAEIDHVFSMEKRHETEALLAEKKATFSTAFFGGVAHGFATRGKQDVPTEKYAKEKALWDLIYWFRTYLS